MTVGGSNDDAIEEADKVCAWQWWNVTDSKRDDRVFSPPSGPELSLRLPFLRRGARPDLRRD
eukprot:1231816-Lingulodinium_polyedra.AAC.1